MKVMNFKKGIVKSGKKVTSEASAQLAISPTYNGFKLNNKAAVMLGVENGGRVVMLDMYDADDPCTQEDRFYICAGNGWLTDTKDKDGNFIEQGAKVTDRTFHYSQIWGSILGEDANAQAISFDDLVENNKAIYTGADGKGKTALFTGIAELTPVQEGEEIEVDTDVYRKLYKLTNIKFKSHNPRVKSVEVDVDAEDIENIED